MTGQVQERVTYDDKGRLDEIVGAGVTHLERMNTSDWFLEIGNADGTSTALWFKSKNLPTLLEKRDAPKRMTGTPSKDRAEGCVVPDYIADAITEAYGERCEDFAAGCHCCEAWSQYDDLVSLRAQADEAETASRNAFAEGMKRAAEIARESGERWGEPTEAADYADAILAEIVER